MQLASIPTALPMIPALTTPFSRRYPDVRYTVWSCTTKEILNLLANLESEAGFGYLDNEPLGKVSTIPLDREKYCLFTKRRDFASRLSVAWAEVAALPLCLLTQDMQNRRIIDSQLQRAGATA